MDEKNQPTVTNLTDELPICNTSYFHEPLQINLPISDLSKSLSILQTNHLNITNHLTDFSQLTLPKNEAINFVNNIAKPFTNIFSDLGNLSSLTNGSLKLSSLVSGPLQFTAQNALTAINIEQSRIFDSLTISKNIKNPSLYLNNLSSSSQVILDTTCSSLQQSFLANDSLIEKTLPSLSFVTTSELEDVKGDIAKIKTEIKKTKGEELNSKFNESTLMVLSTFGKHFTSSIAENLCKFLRASWQVLTSDFDDRVGQAAESMTRLFETLPDILCNMATVKGSVNSFPEKKKRQVNMQVGFWLGLDINSKTFEQDIRIKKQNDFYDRFSNIRHDPNRLGYGPDNLRALIFEAEGFLIQLVEKY